jgi:hypothetical protein
MSQRMQLEQYAVVLDLYCLIDLPDTLGCRVIARQRLLQEQGGLVFRVDPDTAFQELPCRL